MAGTAISLYWSAGVGSLGGIGPFKGQVLNATREVVDSVRIATSASGKEVRTIWATTLRYKYALKINARWGLGEVSDLAGAAVTSYGSGQSFSMTDPVSGTPTTVRFLTPLKLTQQELPGWWQAEFQAISVL